MLKDLIKDGVDYNINEIEVVQLLDDGAEEPLEKLEELKKSMIIKISYSLKLKRIVSVIANYRILVDGKFELLGIPVTFYEKEKQFEDICDYLDDVFESADEVARVLEEAYDQHI